MTSRIALFSLPVAAVLTALACDADEPDDDLTTTAADDGSGGASSGSATPDPPPSGTFACGGGTCDLATEFCVIGTGDGCTSCLPMPAACTDSPTCDCLGAEDHTAFELACTAQGVCEEPEAGGLVLTCTPDGWGCG